jgi:hypothetical protein
MAIHHTRAGGTVQQDFGMQCDGCECREFRDQHEWAFGRRPEAAPRRQGVPAQESRALDQERQLRAAEQRLQRQAEAEVLRLNPIRVFTPDLTTPADRWVPDAVPPRHPAPPPVLPDLAIPPKRWVKRGGR